MMKAENRRFLVKVTIAHMVTYFVCGVFFSLALNYEGVWQSGVFDSNGTAMRDYNSVWIYMGPFLQIFRGLLFGGILLLIPKEFYTQRFAWLKLWIIVAGIGIINTPGPGGGSIEGIIYTTAPWQMYTIYSIEIYVQTLWFSWWVCRRKKEGGGALAARLKYPLIACGLTVLATSLAGVIVAATNGADPMEGAKDPGAMAVLFLMAVMAFLSALWYRQKPEKGRFAAFILAYYLISVLPIIVYNLLTESVFRSPIPLLTALVPTFVIWLIFRRISQKT